MNGEDDMNQEILLPELCAICDEPFTDAEWHNRHTREEDGADVHARCCEAEGCADGYVRR